MFFEARKIKTPSALLKSLFLCTALVVLLGSCAESGLNYRVRAELDPSGRAPLTALLHVNEPALPCKLQGSRGNTG